MDTYSTYIEKRRNSRVQLGIPVELKPTNSSSQFFKAKTVNLSEGGIKLSLENVNLLEDSILDLELPAELEKIRTQGKIIWRRGADYGISFNHVAEKQSMGIKRMLWRSENFIKKNIRGLLNNLSSEMKDKITTFFISDVRKYLGEINSLYLDMRNNSLDKNKGQTRFDNETNKITQRGHALEKLLDNKMISKEIKLVFRSMTGSWVYTSQFMRRGFEKPRGYPGDYKSLEAIYNNNPESEGLGYYFDKFFLNNSYAGAVRQRKNKIVEILEDFIKKNNLPRLKILNLASGSCREVKELVEKSLVLPGEIKITCVDHDDESLVFSQEVLKGLPENFRVDFVKDNVLTMPENQEYYQNLLGKQDLIYSVGLIDYVPDRILKKIIKFWYSLLNSQGTMLLTHKDKDNDPQAPLAPDWYCDWKFVSRNEEHFVNLVKQAIENNYMHLRLERDLSGKIIFLFVNQN